MKRTLLLAVILSAGLLLAPSANAQLACDNGRADLDQSGFVDAGDISVLLLLFGEVDPCCGVNCDDGDPNTVDTCVNGVCQHINPCDDGVPCTIDTIDSKTGNCIHTPRVCDDGIPCTWDSCDPVTGNCVFTPLAGATCNDGNACTTGDICTAGGQCMGVPRDCDDLDPCTMDYCDPLEGCRWTRDPTRPECMTGQGLMPSRMTLVARCTREVCMIMPSCCDADWDAACAAIASTMTSCDAAGATSPLEDTIQSESLPKSESKQMDQGYRSR